MLKSAYLTFNQMELHMKKHFSTNLFITFNTHASRDTFSVTIRITFETHVKHFKH